MSKTTAVGPESRFSQDFLDRDTYRYKRKSRKAPRPKDGQVPASTLALEVEPSSGGYPTSCLVFIRDMAAETCRSPGELPSRACTVTPI